MTNLYSLLKTRDITLPTKVHLVKAIAFPVAMYGHEFEWTPGVGDGQGGLACCDSWGRKESDMTERLNWTELYKVYLDSILKSRDISLSTKVHLVKAMVFPVVMYGCESWTVKKAERRRIESLRFDGPTEGEGTDLAQVPARQQTDGHV